MLTRRLGWRIGGKWHANFPGTPFNWVFRDRFFTDRAAGTVDGTAAEPGPGSRTVTDVEGAIYIEDDRLRGMRQYTSAVWGEAKVVWPALTRAIGRTLCALVTPADAGEFLAFGLASADDIGSPLDDGLAWLFTLSDGQVATPGQAIVLDSGLRFVYNQQYFVAIAYNDLGGYVLLSCFAAYSGDVMLDQVGIPQFPSARVLWFHNGGTDNLYPFVSALNDVGYPYSYPRGHCIEDVRALDVPDWSAADFLAAFADRFTRADSNSALGNSWTAKSGTVWGISSNRAYWVSGSGFQFAHHEMGGYDGILQATIRTPDDMTGQSFGLVVRMVDDSNYLRLWNNGGTASWYLQVWKSGGYDSNIHAWNHTIAAGTEYRLTLFMYGNKYKLFVDGDNCSATTWIADSGNNFLTATKAGFFAVNTIGAGCRWDDITFTPFTVTLPKELRYGLTPFIAIPGATIASDTFTDTDATRLNAHTAEAGGAWVEAAGTWTIASNKASSSKLVENSYVVQDLGVTDVEMSVDIIIPNPMPTNSIRAGFVLHYVDDSHLQIVRLYNDGTGEVELCDTGPVDGAAVDRKTTLGVGWIVAGSTHNLKVQSFRGVIHVFVDNLPRMTYYSASAAGTKFGLYLQDIDDGAVFDNYVVKTL